VDDKISLFVPNYKVIYFKVDLVGRGFNSLCIQNEEYNT